MTPDQLRQWRLSLPRGDDGAPVTKAEAARRLNNTPPQSYGDWERGRKPMPRMLPLALIAVSHGLTLPPTWNDEPEREQ